MEILEGVYGWSVLPSEPELQIRFSSSRNALREALDLLRNEGIVERVPGAGTFVVSKKTVHHQDRLQALAQTLENGRRRIVVDLLDVGLIPAPETVARRLDLAPGCEVVFLERRLILDGTPLSVWSSYLPADLTASLLGTDLTADFYELLEGRLGMDLQSAQLTTEARLADESVAELLEVQPGAPILFLERLMREAHGRPVEFGFVSLRGDRIQFASTVERPGKDVPC